MQTGQTTAEILIVGATGNVGRALVAGLLEAGLDFRVLVRNESRVRLPFNENIEVVHGALDDDHALDIALKGIRKAFLLTRDQRRQGELESNFIRRARFAGVEKIVKSSAFAAGLSPPVGYGIPHDHSERALMASGMEWVILRPYMFMQNLLELSTVIRLHGLLPLPLGQARVALIDARDVAAAARIVLTSDEHSNCIYELGGPAALSMRDCAAILSRVLGHTVRYRSIPGWLAAIIMRMQGVSAWDVAMRKQLFNMIRAGGESGVCGMLECITGQQPRSLEEFAKTHSELLMKNPPAQSPA